MKRLRILGIVVAIGLVAIGGVTACSGGGGESTPPPSGNVAAGGACTANSECAPGLECLSNICTPLTPVPLPTQECITDANCGAGMRCQDSVCVAVTTPTPTPPVQPAVTYKDPSPNATAVPTNATITAIFNKEMNASTINNNTFTVRAGTVSVAGSITYSAYTATFTPSSPLANSTQYVVTLTGGVQDSTGLALPLEVIWSFTTGAAVDTVAPEFPAGFNFAASAPGGMRINLAWGAVSGCGAEGQCDYKVFRTTSGGPPAEVAACRGTAAGSCTDERLTKVLYTYYLEVCDRAPLPNCARRFASIQPVPVAGDVNGDGIPDFIVGAPIAGERVSGVTPAGKAYLYLGSSTNAAPVRAMTISGTVLGDDWWGYLGEIVALMGDINNDGYEDFAIVGEGGNPARSKMGIFFGSAALELNKGINDANVKFVDSARSFARIAPAMDVNGDSIDDVIVGLITTADNVLAYVIPGRANWSGYTIANDTMKLSYTDATVASGSLVTVSSAGADFDGDGAKEVVVGIPSLAEIRVLKKDLDYGNNLLFMNKCSSPSGSDNFGSSVLGYGWMQQASTRVPTVFVGAPMADISSLTDSGMVYQCVLGSLPTSTVLPTSPSRGEQLGLSLCGAVNGGSRALGTPMWNFEQGHFLVRSMGGDFAWLAGVRPGASGTPGDRFGASCAVSSTLVNPTSGADASYIVGAPGVNADKGKVYIINNNNPTSRGTWVEVSGDAAGDGFGFSVGARLCNPSNPC